MNLKAASFNIAVIGLSVCLFLELAFAQGNVGFKRLEWHATVKESFKYDDNIFLDADKTFANGTLEMPTDDFISVLSPSIQIKKQRLRGEFFGFDAHYDPSDTKYIYNPSENNLEHDAGIELNFADRGEHTRLKLLWTYIDTVEPFSTEFASNIAPRARSVSITWRGVLEHNISKRLKVTATGGFGTRQFKDVSLSNENIKDTLAGVNTFIQITPMTAIGLKYNYRSIRYTNFATTNKDSDTHNFAVAVRLKPTAIISGDLALGYESKSLDRTIPRRNFMYQANLIYDLNNRTKFHLKGKRGVEDSSFASTDSYINTELSLAWEQAWTSRINSTVKGSWTNRNYDALVADFTDGGGELKIREDNEFMLEIKGEYELNKWLNAGLSYEFKRNISNFNSFDYNINIFTLFLSTGF